MKTIKILCAAISLTLVTAGSANADWGRHNGYRQGGHDYRHQNQSHRHGWAGPAALLAITGLAIGATAYAAANPAPVYAPAPVYVAPPRAVYQPQQTGNWYFCGSSGQYYPYVRHCPEGWQEVMPPR